MGLEDDGPRLFRTTYNSFGKNVTWVVGLWIEVLSSLETKEL